MVLGTQWLESLGPILWDFCCGTLAFVWNGHHIIWTAVAVGSTSPLPSSLFATESKLLDELLQEFVPLF
jgi:hypothetical protein